MDGVSVGNIALDLVIKDKIGEQLEMIRQSASIPAQKVGEVLADAIAKPVGKVSSAVNDSLSAAASKASQAMQKSLDSVRENVGKISEDMDSTGEFTVHFHTDDVEKAVEDIREKAESLREENDIVFHFHTDVNNAIDEIESAVNSANIQAKLSIKTDIPDLGKQAGNAAQEAVENIGNAFESVREQVKNGVDIPVNADIPDIGSQLEDSVNNIDISAIEERIDSTMSNIRAMLSNVEISSDPTQRLAKELELTEEKISLVHARWQELQSALSDDITGADVGKITEKLNKAEAEMLRLAATAEKLQGRIEKLSEENISVEAEPLNFEVKADDTERLSQEIELLQRKITGMQEKWRGLSQIKDPTTKVRAQLIAVEQQIISATAKLEKLRQKMTEAEAVPVPFTEPESRRREGNAEKAESSVPEDKKAAPNDTVAEDIYQKTKKSAKKTENIFVSAFRTIRSFGSKAFRTVSARIAALGKASLSVMSPIAKLGKTLKNAFKSAVLMAGVYAAFRTLRKGLEEAALADKEFSNSLNSVKANLAVAFAPILQTVMPMLNTFMAGLAAVTKQVAGFISGLFGATYAQSAKAAQKLQNTAKTAQDTAKKVKTAMAGIDEMNVLSADTGSDDTDNEAEDKQDGIDWSKVDMSEPKLPDWAEKLKNAIRSGDWNGVGEVFAERVNAAFGAVNWDKVSEKVNRGVQSVVDIINGFIGKVDWDILGDTLAGGINTVTSALNTFWDGVDWSKLGKGLGKGLNRTVRKVDWTSAGKALTGKLKAFIETAYSFTEEFDFAQLGRGIGDGINAAFSNVDFAKAGAVLSNSIKGLFDILIRVIERIDWGMIGKKIWQFVSAIDYSGIAKRLFELLGAALGAAVSLLWGFLSGIVDKIQEHFEAEFERMNTGNIGADIILGILVGIGDAIIGIGKWIYDNVFTPFINGFKKAFDIHSTSKVMEKMGWTIVDGLFDAISDGISKIKEIFEKMRDTITGVFDNIDTWFRKKFSDAWTKIKNVFSGIGQWFSARWGDIRAAFAVTDGWFGDKFTDAASKVKSAFSGIDQWFGTKWDEVKGKFSDVKDFFTDKFQQAYDAVTGIWKGIGQFFWDIWETVSNRAKDGMNWLMGRVEDGINRIIDGLNSLSIDAPEWVQEKLGVDHFGFSVPHVSLPRLASGGIATAPTLAMVGDNRNASIDPEVISPLSKLKGMVGSDPEVVELLRMIIELLKNGMNIEIINYLFKNSREFSREVLKVIAEDNARRGQ